MFFERVSPFSGKTSSMEIAVTQKQLDAWEGGELIQRAMPLLTAVERAFITTGISPDEWKESIGE